MTSPVAKNRLRQFRVPVLIVAMAAVLAGTRGLNVLAAHNPITAVLVGFATAVAALFAYKWLARTVESRETVDELPDAGRWTNLRRGLLIGAGALTAMMLIIGMFGGWDHIGWGGWSGLFVTLGMMASVAVNEELLFRGIIFRILEERTGTVVALVISSVLFGLTHLVNDGATIWGTLAIGIEGGTMLCAAYALTRSLWLPIGIHFAWNFTEAGFFGVATSGTEQHGLFDTTLSGPTFLTGGAFGPEASFTALLVCLVPTVIMIRRARRSGQIRQGNVNFRKLRTRKAA
ncbi:lysostaphin resistance A-like protein [Actinoplanes sp. NPDC051494]|uniref:lysostaphin resistance A-like protein n=1 Tax=Actinoplanes sp. NPDC051494 TaxID=3363907 RepID=UPI003791EE25